MVEGLRSFIVLGSMVGICVFLSHWILDEVLPCPTVEIVYRERPYSFKEWSEWERIAVNVHSIFREIEEDGTIQSPIELFRKMADLKKSGS